MPPRLDNARVERLARLADRLDGCRETHHDCQSLLDAFNREAGTDLPLAHFQGFTGGADPETFVRNILAEPAKRRLADITQEELLELIRRVSNAEGSEHEQDFWLGLLEANLPDPRISDLIFWPGEYFSDGKPKRELSPSQIVQIAQARDNVVD